MSPFNGEAGDRRGSSLEEKVLSDLYSSGHRVALPTAVQLISTCLKGYRFPEPIRQAHLAANMSAKNSKTKREKNMSVEGTPKQQILNLFKQLTISEEQFNTFNENIEKKLVEKVLQAREAELQPELNRIYGLYKVAVEGHKVNLKAQYDLAKNTYQRMDAIEDLTQVVGALVEFRRALDPYLEAHKKLEAEIKDFEDRIVTLLPAKTVFLS